MLLQSDVQEHVFTFKVILYICSTCQQSAAVAELVSARSCEGFKLELHLYFSVFMFGA